MKKAVVVLVAGISAVVASAHPQDGDRLTALSQGTLLKTLVDLNIPANVSTVYFRAGKQLRVGVTEVGLSYCLLSLKASSPKDRVIPAGKELVVKSTRTDSNYYKDYAADPATGKSVKSEGARLTARFVEVKLESKNLESITCANQGWVPAGASSDISMGEGNYPTIGQLKAAMGDMLQIVHPQPDVIDGEFEE